MGNTCRIMERDSGFMKKFIPKMAVVASLCSAAGFLLYRRFEDLYRLGQLGSLRRILKREMGVEKSARIVDGVERHYEEISARWPATLRGIMRLHRIFLIMAFAIYKALVDEFGGDEDIPRMAERLVWESGPTCKRPTELFFKLFFVGSKDPFARFAPFAKRFIDFMYPCPLYAIEYVEEEGVVGFDYVKCPYPRFYEEHGMEVFGRALCQLDFRWAELLPPQIGMRREHTLSEGADKCDFRLYRK